MDDVEQVCRDPVARSIVFIDHHFIFSLSLAKEPGTAKIIWLPTPPGKDKAMGRINVAIHGAPFLRCCEKIVNC